MNKLKPLSVGKRVLFTFGTLCAILPIIGGLVFFSLRSIERGKQLQQSRALNKLALIDDTAQDVGQMQAEALRQVLASDMGEIKRLDQGVRDIEKINARELADYQKFIDTEKERQLYDRVMQARKAYWEQTQPVLALGLSNRDAEATEWIISKQAPAYDEYLKAINELIKYVETDAKETARATTRFISKIRIVGDVLAGVAILIAIGTGFAVAGVARRLKEGNNILQAEIKERKQAEEKLSWKTAFLEAQVNSSLDGILVVDQQGKKILQNQRTADLLKMPQHIADGKDDEKQRRWVAGRTKNPEQFVEKVAYLYSHPNEIGRDETEFKDGTILDRYSAPVVGKDGKYYGRIWTFRDITGRKRTEEQLRVQATALDAAANAIVITDHNGTIQSVNPAFTALTGYTAQEAVGQNPRLLKSGKHDDAFYRKLWQTISSGQVWSGELTNRRKDGSLYVEEMTITPLRNADGTIARYIAIKQDVSERKRAQDALRQSEEQLRAMFDLASVGIAQADPRTGQWLRVNKKMCEITGYSVGELLQMRIEDITYPADRQSDREAFERVVRGQAPNYRLEKRYTRKDGALAWVNVNMTIIRDAAGQPTRTVAAIEDITGRKELEAQMERLRVEHALILNSIGEGVHWVDVDGRIKFENPAAAKMLGYEVSELLGQPAHSTMHHTRADGAAYLQSECPIYATLKDGAVRRVTDEVFWRKDGSSFAVEYICTPIYDKNGRSGGSVVIFTDITARKRAEEALRASQQIIEGIINAIPVRVFWKDKNLIYLGCNAIFARDAGFADPKDIIGKDDYQMGWRDQAELYRGDDRQVIESGCSKLLIEEPQTTPAGETITLLSSKLPLRGSKGEISGVLGTYMDITARKRLETQLFQSQKLETVGKLAGGVAHEFNSILTAIIGQSELILADLPSGHPLFQNAAGIRRAAERAATLTRQLLAYGRRAFLRPESLDLNQVMAGTEGMVRQLMGGDVDMRIVPAEGLRAVKADAGQIEQVIMNLAMNARDAMPNGGKLTLETANVSFDQERVGRDPELKPGDYVMLAITDTGTGMSAEVKARAFEPFFTTKGVGQGTGLGLSTCYGIIKQSGGHISIYSEPGRGTTFKIYLPQVEPQTKIPLQRLDSPDLPRGTETILLVEDDPALREMAATLLRRLGYTVLAAANGVEALSLKPQRDSGPIDLLFTDVVMPHMNGKELSERVRALHPHTRTLFTSAYTENAIVHQGVLNPGVALLQKPFTPSALAHKLREVLDQPGAPKPDPAQKTSGFTKITDGVNTP